MGKKTILSAAIAIAEVLKESGEVAAITDRIIPVGELDITAPYVVFRREHLIERAVKDARGSDQSQIELLCVSNDYEQSLELAEAVRDAIDGCSVENDEGSIKIRSCRMADATEYKLEEAFVQQLKFIIKL